MEKYTVFCSVLLGLRAAGVLIRTGWSLRGGTGRPGLAALVWAWLGRREECLVGDFIRAVIPHETLVIHDPIKVLSQ